MAKPQAFLVARILRLSLAMKSAMQRFHDVLKSFDTAMLVTRTPTNGVPVHVRPMAIANVTPQCALEFFTLIGSSKIGEIGQDSHVQVVCQSRNVFVSVTGRAKLSRDPDEIERLWRDSYRAWFPKGKADPELALMSVQAEEAELWDQHGASTLRHLFDVAKAFVTGRRPAIAEAEHAKARLAPPRP